MAKIQPQLSPANDLLMNNGAGLFLVLPTVQIRNIRHKEHEIENPCKYHGLFWGTQKLFDSWFATLDGTQLSPESQKGFSTDLAVAEKSYEVGGKKITEEVFLPDGIPALAISYFGEFSSLQFQPELDIRDRYSSKWSDYASECAGSSCVSSSQGFFVAMGSDGEAKKLSQYRYKFYPQDYERSDIAERWAHSPAILTGKRFFFGFGKSREEALANMERIRRNLEEMKLRKAERLRSLSSKLHLNTPDSELADAFSLVVAQFLSMQNGPALPASGDRWFAGDRGWLRDAMVSLEAYFELGLFENARAILELWMASGNMNGEGIFADRLDPAQWRGFDGTLWLLRRFGEYCLLSKDKQFLATHSELARSSLENIIDKRLTERGYLRCKPYETWMDTKFTPREGFPVEVQALFIYDCMLLAKFFDGKFAAKLLRSASDASNALINFRCKAKAGDAELKYLADHLSPTLARNSAITPNQLIACECGILDKETESDVLELCAEKLAGKGVRTLAPGELSYFDKHVGDGSYHRGSQWPFLNMFAAKCEMRRGRAQEAFSLYIQPLISDILAKDVGGVPELYNGDGTDAPVPHYQAWSMASFIVMCKEYERAMLAPAK